MNALLGLILMTILLLVRWRGHTRLMEWMQALQKALRACEARQYDQGLSDACEFQTILDAQLRAGRLQPQALRSLLTWIRSLEQADAERLRTGYSAALRLGLAAGLALVTSLVLEGHWFLRLASNPPALLLLLGHALLLSFWLRRLPAHPLALSRTLQANFTRAWLGLGSPGPWHEAWIQEQDRGRLSGRDVRIDQQRILEDWLVAAGREQEKRLTLADELFGLVELASSVYFLGIVCLLPLLRLWGGSI